MYALRNKINAAMFNTYVRCLTTAKKARIKLQERDGSFFTEHALAIVITVVVAIVLIGALLLIWQSKIIPGLSNAIDDFFGMA